MRDTVRVSSEASAALAAVLAQVDGRDRLERAVATVRALAEPDPVRRAERARRAVDAELVTVALGQLTLRERAHDKFGEQADTWFFTADGLEQSSRIEAADHRALRFAAEDVPDVLDLCCGLGADAAAFVRQGLATRAVELSPDIATIAATNLGAGAHVTTGRAEDADWRSAGSVFLDPARRTSRGRTFDPSSFSPPFEFVREVITEHRHAAAKLSPGLPHDLVPDGVEAEWVSWQGGVKECVLWSSGFARARRRATLLPAHATLTEADESRDDVRAVGRFVHEPDGAVIRAGLVQQVAALLPDGARLDEHLAYLTTDEPSTSPFTDTFEVIDVLPYSVKVLRAELRRRAVGIVEIKKRGVDIDPATLRRELKPSGPNSLTVLLARIGNERRAILAHRV